MLFGSTPTTMCHSVSYAHPGKEFPGYDGTCPARKTFLNPLTVAVMLLTALLCSPGTLRGAVHAGNQDIRQGLAKGNNDFALSLFRQLDRSGENLFFSPYSISSAMGMVFEGSRANTSAEVQNVMHFRFGREQLAEAFWNCNHDLMSRASASGQKLNIANALVLTGDTPGKPYTDRVRKYYDAEIFPGGLDKINAWVADKTMGRIPSILQQLDSNSMFVLLNAIWFKSSWESAFRRESTSDMPFSVSPKKQVTVKMMYQKHDFSMVEEKELKAIGLPYRGGELSMVIFLPRAKDGLARFEKSLTPQRLSDLLSRLDSQSAEEIELSFPKFTMTAGYDLVRPFRKMGMSEAFGEKADFTGMGFRPGEVWIGQIRHKAFVEVNEEGTEAAGATAVEFVTKALPYSKEFKADHPFLFLIRDNRQGTILFMGRVCDPTSR